MFELVSNHTKYKMTREGSAGGEHHGLFQNYQKQKKLLKILVDLKKILTSLIFNDDLEKRTINQRLILSNLINNKFLPNIFEYRYFNEFKAVLQQKSGKYDDYIEFYCSYISLLAELSWEFK